MNEKTTDLVVVDWNKEQKDLIKRTVAKGSTDDELALFLYQARRTGLDPLLKQIHAIKRWDASQQREVMTLQTGIDGYRLVADRTGKYAPGREPTFIERDGKLFSATAYVKKQVGDTWHEVSATAFFEEYAQKKKDGSLTAFWLRMPRSQLAKCAEALALRRAFPAELSGVYTHEEMQQADKEPTKEPAKEAEAEIMTESQGEVSPEAKPPEDDSLSEPEKEFARLMAVLEANSTPSQIKTIRSALDNKPGVKENLLNKLDFLRKEAKARGLDVPNP